MKVPTLAINGSDGQSTLVRAAHDIGLAAWFGGSLMGAVGVNGATERVQGTHQRMEVANAAWARWTPANLVAIGANLVTGTILIKDNWPRLRSQKGVLAASVAKTGLTAAALAATAYSRVLGERLIQAGDFPAESVTKPSDTTPPEIARAQRRLARLQWVVPALTGAAMIVNAKMGEQQRPNKVAKGIAAKLLRR